MHFVTGGAFQGKRRWVFDKYKLKTKSNWKWHNFYENCTIPTPLEVKTEKIVVFEGLEEIIKKMVYEKDPAIQQKWEQVFLDWYIWEKECLERKVVFIGCDISKGIVPLQELDRKWRDETGFCYQKLVRLCSRVDIIWNGLAQPIKMEGGNHQ